MWRGNVEVERETGGGERHHTETDRVVNLHWTRTPCTLSGTTKQTDAAQSQHEHSRINRAKKPKKSPGRRQRRYRLPRSSVGRSPCRYRRCIRLNSKKD